jgi:hypothetical protein
VFPDGLRVRSFAGIYMYLATCGMTEVPGSGTVTITSADEERVRGRVDLVFADGSTATGAFDAPVCDQGGDVCLGTAIHEVSPDASCLP